MACKGNKVSHGTGTGTGAYHVNAAPQSETLPYPRPVPLFLLYRHSIRGICRLSDEDLVTVEDGVLGIKTFPKKTKISYEVPLLAHRLQWQVHRVPRLYSRNRGPIRKGASKGYHRTSGMASKTDTNSIKELS